MASLPLSLLSLLLTLLTIAYPTRATTCTTSKLTNTNLYKNCNDLSSLSSALHWTYTPTNKTLSIAFTSSPASPSGWVAWGINPKAQAMAGTQAILAFKNTNGSMSVKTFNISSYSDISEGDLSFKVFDKRAEFDSKDGSITIFATVESGGGKVNHVWQAGPGVSKGFPQKHDFKPQNLNSKGDLDLSSHNGGAAQGSSTSGGGGGGMKKRNTHGILNAISWGILFPLGAIIARYLRTFESADPAWFYVHATCQVSAYAIGVSGWATGLQLGSESKAIVYTGHRYIGLALFCLATVQIFALFLRPMKDHKYRFYWNIYHHSIGYAIIILGIINVFKGLKILEPEKKWKSTYVTIIIVLGCVAVLLEAFTWILMLKRKPRRSTKPYA